MFRKLTILSLLTLGLTGCLFNSGNTSVDNTVNAVIAGIASKCQYQADLAPIETIVSKLITQGTVDVGSLVTQVCNAVTNKAAVPGKCQEVNGVCITGHFN